jgi:hypothetical protein
VKVEARSEVLSESEEVHALEADHEATMRALVDRVYSRSDTWVQELLANARDGIRERLKAAEPDYLPQIEVVVDRNTVRISDNGTGMSHNLLTSVFRVLGRSTRSGSDDYTGAWGIGSKSPLKICDQYTMTTRSQADSMEYRLTIGRLQSMGKTLWGFRFDAETPCSGDWGTTVEVAVPPDILDACLERIRHTARYWTTPMRVTVNGGSQDLAASDPHDRATFKAKLPWGTASMKPSARAAPMSVLVDGIQYPATSIEGYSVTLELARPSFVDLTSGREDLNFNEKTEAFLNQARSDLQEALTVAAIAQLECLKVPFAGMQLGIVRRADELLAMAKAVWEPQTELDGRHLLLACIPNVGIRRREDSADAVSRAMRQNGWRSHSITRLYEAWGGERILWHRGTKGETVAKGMPAHHANGYPDPTGDELHTVVFRDEKIVEEQRDVLQRAGLVMEKIKRNEYAFRAKVAWDGYWRDIENDLANVPQVLYACEGKGDVELFLSSKLGFVVQPSKSFQDACSTAGIQILTMQDFKAHVLAMEVDSTQGRRNLRSFLGHKVDWSIVLPVAYLNAFAWNHPALVGPRWLHDAYRSSGGSTTDYFALTGSAPNGSNIEATLTALNPVLGRLLDKSRRRSYDYDGFGDEAVADLMEMVLT